MVCPLIWIFPPSSSSTSHPVNSVTSNFPSAKLLLLLPLLLLISILVSLFSDWERLTFPASSSSSTFSTLGPFGPWWSIPFVMFSRKRAAMMAPSTQVAIRRKGMPGRVFTITAIVVITSPSPSSSIMVEFTPNVIKLLLSWFTSVVALLLMVSFKLSAPGTSSATILIPKKWKRSPNAAGPSPLQRPLKKMILMSKYPEEDLGYSHSKLLETLTLRPWVSPELPPACPWRCPS